MDNNLKTEEVNNILDEKKKKRSLSQHQILYNSLTVLLRSCFFILIY